MAEIFSSRKIVYFHKKNIKYWFTKWERFNLAKELEYKNTNSKLQTIQDTTLI